MKLRKSLHHLPLSSFWIAAIWREINSDQPQPREAFIEALSRVLARWMLSRSQSPELETMTTLSKTRSYVVSPDKIL